MKSETKQAMAAVAATETKLLGGVELPDTERAMRGAAEAAAPGAGAAADTEPVYDKKAQNDIQGNIIPGFNKDHQQFLFLRFGPVKGARQWLAWLAPRLSTMGEVLAFRKEFRAQRLRLGVREPGMTATWRSVALSHGGIAALVGAKQAAAFGEQSFRQGLAARSTYLGDPTDPAQAGHRDNWVVGGSEEADALVIVAADDPVDLEAAVTEVQVAATDHGITVLLSQRGDALTGNLQGHEHFGFKDGISQPGVRGWVASTPNQRITPRHLAAGDPHARLFAKPGQALVWPGQFLLGEPRQDTQDPFLAAAPASNFPPWARRGSYLVCRRLSQDVVAFWDFMTSAGLGIGMDPVHFASTMVGRWPSGAPVMRVPGADDPALAGDEFANNHFLFSDPTRPSVIEPIPGYGGDTHPVAAEDVFGRVCPHVAHIRKVNPRDSGSDFGAPADTLLRLMLRRGIPFGQPIVGVKNPSEELIRAERGLMFLAYMSSIEDQFEFVTRRWANSPVQPNTGGHDPIIGQRDQRGDRERSVEVPVKGGTTKLTLPDEWVRPTGGGYFFAPPISAVAGVLAGRDP